MRRLPALLLMLWFTWLGSGLAGYLHALEHLESGEHEEECPIHAMLAAPLVLQGPPEVPAGQAVALAAEIPESQGRSLGVVERVDCRGPPGHRPARDA